MSATATISNSYPSYHLEDPTIRKKAEGYGGPVFIDPKLIVKDGQGNVKKEIGSEVYSFLKKGIEYDSLFIVTKSVKGEHGHEFKIYKESGIDFNYDGIYYRDRNGNVNPISYSIFYPLLSNKMRSKREKLGRFFENPETKSIMVGQGVCAGLGLLAGLYDPIFGLIFFTFFETPFIERGVSEIVDRRKKRKEGKGVNYIFKQFEQSRRGKNPSIIYTYYHGLK